MPLVVRNDFPDITFLKQEIQKQGGAQSWPTVILNAKEREDHRPGIVGPFSIFMNLHGHSWCMVDGHRVRVDTGHFFISNYGQSYTLDLESEEPVETFNLHLEAQLIREVWGGMNRDTGSVLDDPFREVEAAPGTGNGKSSGFDGMLLANRLQEKDETLARLCLTLKNEMSSGEEGAIYAGLGDILQYIFRLESREARMPSRLDALRSATREELFRRLGLATDYLYSHFEEAIDLEQLAATAALSKYHFLRLFKQAYGVTPYQYLLKVRLEYARKLLSGTRAPVSDIAIRTGFDSLSAFTRQFSKRIGVSPTAFRSETGISQFL